MARSISERLDDLERGFRDLMERATGQEAPQPQRPGAPRIERRNNSFIIH